jgi:hypothetical protein
LASERKDNGKEESVYHFKKGRVVVERTWTTQPSRALTREPSKEKGIIQTILADVAMCKESPKNCAIAEERRVRELWKYLITGFFLGLVPSFVFPKILMSEPKARDGCITRGYVTKTNVEIVGEGRKSFKIVRWHATR